MMHVFAVLAKMKFLRGTAFDIFGYSAERRTERALIEQYRQTISSLLQNLTPDSLSTAVAIASLPETVRGFGHIKERNIEAAREKQVALLREFHAGGREHASQAQQAPAAAPKHAA
jgi:indolepyruvate ferredoxin oxidoreductase